MRVNNGKIFIVAEVPFPEGMASTACVSLMAKGLSANGAGVCLAVMSNSFNAKADERGQEGVYNGIPFHIFNNHNAPKGHFSRRSYQNIKDLAQLLQHRHKQNYQDTVLLYDNNFFKYYALLRVCKRYNISYIPWEVERNSASSPGKGLRGYISWYTKRLSERLVCRQANKMIVISSQLKFYFTARIRAERIHIAPIMVDPQEAMLMPVLEDSNFIKETYDALQKEYAVIVYSGSFGEKDGFPYILAAFERYAKLNHKVCLVCTGKPSKYTSVDDLLSQVKDKEIRSRIHYFGLVSRTELNYINRQADLLLVCRSNSEFARHGFPWKLGEYLMTKNPIIATRVGDLERYFSDDELFIAQPEDADAIYQQMMAVFADKKDAMKKAGKAYVKALELFDYKQVTQECLAFILSQITRSTVLLFYVSNYDSFI